MKRLMLTPVIAGMLTLAAPVAWAAFDGPNAETVTEIAEVAEAPNGCLCVLEGTVTEKVKGEKDHYVMTDPTGNVYVEIEDVVFSDKNITPKDKIRAYGRIDKDQSALGKDPDVVEVYFFEII